MKKSLLLLVILVTSMVTAQTEPVVTAETEPAVTTQIDFSVSTLTGYENNLNRNPDTFTSGGTPLAESDLLRNSAYQDAVVEINYKKTFSSAVLKLDVVPQGRFYFSESDFNKMILNSRLNYKKNFGKTQWETNVRHIFKDRKFDLIDTSGDLIEANELRIPFGYNLVKVYSRLFFKLHEDNQTFIRFNYAHKNFYNTQERSIAYNGYGGDFKYKTTKDMSGFKYSYGVFGGFSERNYNIAINAAPYHESRLWHYYNAAMFLEFPICKKLRIKSIFEYKQRDDKSDTDRFGYKQYTPKFRLSYVSDKFTGKFTSSYATREYNTLTAANADGSSKGAVIDQEFLKFKLDLEYSINKNFSIISEGFFRESDSNHERLTSLVFRSYSNYYGGLGLRWNM